MANLNTLFYELVSQIIDYIDEPFTMTSLSRTTRQLNADVTRALGPCVSKYDCSPRAHEGLSLLNLHKSMSGKRSSEREYTIATRIDLGDHHVYYQLIFTNYFTQALSPVGIYSTSGLAILQWACKYIVYPTNSTDAAEVRRLLSRSASAPSDRREFDFESPLKQCRYISNAKFFSNDMRRVATWMTKVRREVAYQQVYYIEEDLMEMVAAESLAEEQERMEAQALMTAAKCDFGVLPEDEGDSKDEDMADDDNFSDSEGDECEYSDASD